jgi:hypothetical protein
MSHDISAQTKKAALRAGIVYWNRRPLLRRVGIFKIIIIFSQLCRFGDPTIGALVAYGCI